MSRSVWDREFKRSDDALHPSQSPGRWEWWYFDADFEDGHSIAGTFHFGSPRPPAYPDARFIEITLYDPSGEKRLARKRYPLEECSASLDTCRVAIGPNIYEGELPHYHVAFREGDCGCDLHYEALVQPYGPVETGWGGSTMGWSNSAARSRVTGTITWEGTTIPVKGEGYHDHNWADAPMSAATLTANAFWGRLYLDEWTLNWQGGRMVRKLDHRPAGRLIIWKGRDIVAITDKVSGTPTGYTLTESGIEYPRHILISCHDPGIAEGDMTLEVKRVIHFMDLHSRLKPFQRWFEESFVGPSCYYRHRFDYALDVLVCGEAVQNRGSSWCEHHRWA